MIVWSSLSPEQQIDALARPIMDNSAELAGIVADIIQQVDTNGDKALQQLTATFDGVQLSTLQYSSERIQAAQSTLSDSRKLAIETAYQQIYRFHSAQQSDDVTVETMPGVVCSLRTAPIDSVGLYIPAGSAPLPSTVLMLGVPAKIAGCRRVALTCPPAQDGTICAEILYAASLCGIEEIYTLGGAQAIAALALGTESIEAVNKVFGPGNRFVTEAKRQLSQQVPGFAIDMPAGPSEVLVIADANANASFVASDLLSQAEHGPDSQVILVTNSAALLTEVSQQLAIQVEELSRREIAKKSLEQSRLILTDTIEQAVQVSNEYGPEHLIVQTDNAEQLLNSLTNAGSIFVGAYTPESAGDYASGTNHVLPTYGYSKVVSSLSLADFSRRYTVQQISKAGLQALAPTLIELTDAEGLDGHQRAVTIRLEENS